MLKGYRFRDLRIRLIVYVIILSIIGIVVIGSAKHSLQMKQMIGLCLALTGMSIFTVIDYKFLLRFYWIWYIIAVLLLVAVLALGEEVNGATRWISVAGIQFQPSEFAKVLLILFFSAFFTNHREKINDIKFLCISFGLFSVPALLIIKEPNLSTTIIVSLLFVTLLFIAGLSYKIIGSVLAVGIPLGIIGLILIIKRVIPFHVYQYNRIMAWIHPSEYSDNAYQQVYSVKAIASGQLWGKGLYNNSITSVKNGNFISEPQTDFIFSVVGEELGFVGCIIVIGLLLLIVFECIRIARKSSTLQGTMIASAVAAWIGFQGFINICVATGMMPNTGQPLPFVSYGLTSLVSLYIGIGLSLIHI